MNLKSYLSLLTRLLILVFLGFSIPAIAQYQTPRVFDGTDPNVKGYLEYLPDDFATNPTKQYPIMVFFHGIGEEGNGTTQIQAVATNGPPKIIAAGQWPSSFQVGNQNFKFIVISPQASVQWQAPDIDYVISQCKAIYGNRIDPSRIYVTGLSLGGGGVEDFLAYNSANSKSIAAAVICCGASYWSNQTRINNIAQANTPIWFFHNEFDNSVNYLQSVQWTQHLDATGMNPLPKLTIYPGVYAHDSWSWTYDIASTNPNKIYEWMLSYTNPQGAPPPVSNAGASQVINLPGSITLDGTGSTAPSGNIVSYQWTHINGTWGDVISSPNSAKTSVSFINPGNYIYQLTVTDNNGNVNSSYTHIYVNPAGAVQPVAVAGNPQTVPLVNYGVNLNASGSSAPGSFIQTYLWTKISGPQGDIIINPSQQITSLSFTYPGTYTYALTLTDGNGNFGMSTVKVTVTPTVTSPPVSVPGTNQTINLPAQALLNGSGSTDPSGTISTYAWTKISGPAGDKILSPGTASTNVSFTSPGSYVYQLAVTDNATGLSNSANITITVNGAPVSVPGANQTINLPALASLNGSASTDPSGSISSYTWTKISGPSGDKITSPGSASTTISFTSPGAYVYQLTVTDNVTGLSNSANIYLTVNGAPVSIPGQNQTVSLPGQASLDGSLSTDPSGTIGVYSWTKVSGPAGDQILSPASAKTNISFFVVGTYVYKLTVKDNTTGLSNSATISINVIAGPTAVAGQTQTIILPGQASLNGSSSTDPSGTISSYTWTKVSGPAGDLILSANTAITNISFTNTGTYVYQLTVKDNGTGLSNSNTITLTVLSLPVSVPGPGQTITLPAQVSLNGSGSSDNSGTITSYTWSKVSGPSGDQILSPNQAKTNISFTLSGIYVYQLTVLDNNGLSNSSNITILVNAPIYPPVANAGLNQTVILPSQAILDGTGSTAPSGTISIFSWTKVSGPSGDQILSPAQSKSNVSYTNTGTYVYQLTIVDNNNGTSSSQVTVTVNNPPATSAAAQIPATSNPATVSNTAYLQVPAGMNRTLINFGNLYSLAPAPWNNIGFIPTTTESIKLLDINGNTSASISVPKLWSGADTGGVNTSNNSGVYPDMVLKSLYTYTKSDTALVLLSGLDTNKMYNLTFFGSWVKPWSGAITYYMVGQNQVGLNTANNKDSTVAIKGITPNPDGTILVKVLKDSQTAAAIINSIVMDSYAPGLYPPGSPIIISSAGLSKHAIQLNWAAVKGAKEYYVYRSVNSTGPFTLIDSLKAGTNTLIDSMGLYTGVYYYAMVAGNGAGKSSMGPVVMVQTLISVVDVSFNSDQPAGSPWNDMNGGTSFTNLKTTDNQNSYINLNITRNFTGKNVLGFDTYSNTGVYPDAVLRGQYYSLSPDSAIIQLSGLYQSNAYNLTFLSSWLNPWGSAITSFSSQNQTVSLDPTNNAAKVVSLKGLLPDKNGLIQFVVKAKFGSFFGILNAMVIQSYTNLTGTVNSSLSIGKVLNTNSVSLLKPVLSTEDIHVYPNPFTTSFNVGVNSSTAGKYKITLFDINGNQVFDEDFQNLETGFNWREMNFPGQYLKSGIYIMRIHSDQFADTMYKLIKN